MEKKRKFLIMRLFYINPSRIPTEKAHGYQIAKMCESFAKTRVNGSHLEVHLIVPKRRNPIKEDVFEFYQLQRNFKVHYLPVPDLITKFSAYPVCGYLVYILHLWLFGKSAKKFIAQQKLNKEDIIYTRNSVITWFFRRHSKVVLEIHAINKLTFTKFADLVVVITQHLKQFIKKDNMMVAPDGVDLSNFDNLPSKQQARRLLNLPVDKKLVGYVGKFKTAGGDFKGVETLLKAVSLINDNKIAAVVVGIMPEEFDLLKKIVSYYFKEPNRVLLVPFQKRNIVPMYLKAMDILAMPSPKKPFYQYYTSPLKMFEYMASGTPIAASDLPALKEVLNSNNAVMVEPENALKWAQAIRRLITDKSLAASLSRQALADVQNYTWQKRAAKIISQINEV